MSNNPCQNDAEYFMCEHKINVLRARCRECEKHYEHMNRSRIYRPWKEEENENSHEKNQSGRRKPYTCPVCEGNGKINLRDPLVHRNGLVHFMACNACEGEGVVWG